MNLNDAIWHLKEENRKLQSGIENVMRYAEMPTEEEQEVERVLISLDSEVNILQEEKRAMLSRVEEEQGYGREVNEDSVRLEVEVEGSNEVLQGLHAQEQAMLAQVNATEDNILDYNKTAEARREHLLLEHRELLDSIPTMQAHLARLQQQHELFLTPHQSLQNTLDSLLTSAHSDTVPLPAYTALQDQCNELHSKLSGLVAQ
eukprot:TRINITY_DN3224_c0_g1_i2.p1 TRINITY_DN3224_c0_g1~~TRINITY_DN3224_c0_g1_i2.p1  ORF type:complete len:233 (+),score=65.93 TRINITY_DN3224_c0_g1_i2:93-701(+)